MSSRQSPTPDVFRRFYESHISSLLAFASRRVGPDSAEDLVSETFIKAYRRAPSDIFIDDRQASMWLFRVLRNLIISRARHLSIVERKAHLLVDRSPSTNDDHEPSALEEQLSPVT